MERIKEALDKAKSLRSGQGLQPPQARQPTIAWGNASKLPHIDDELASIVYSRSQVVGLDPEHLEHNRIVAQNKNDTTSWVFDSLRTQVLQQMEERHWRTMAIISPTAAAGKSVVAINLAISIAQQPQKTAMLVDFDLRKPSVAQYLGIKQQKSINDYLAGDAELAEIIVNPGIPHLTVILTNKPVNKSSETLSSKGMQRLIVELKERYDSRIVIFDLPPILNVDDALVVLPQVDCVLLVLGDGLHTESEISNTMRLLGKSNILGVVINRAEAEPSTYYY
jgi:protein-tyrosine kinase